MPISREEVHWLYRCLLGRLPETADGYEFHMAVHPTFESARESFMKSGEFQAMVMPPVYYREARPDVNISKPDGIALVTIVKDEEEHIEQMINSCLPLIDYAIVADTGSRDSTKEKARAVLQKGGVGHEIVDVTWIDFSSSRNAALSRVPMQSKWILMLDADEHLVSADYHLLIETLAVSNEDVIALPRYNFVDSEKANPVSAYPDFQSRLIRNLPMNPVRFEGALHERIVGEYKTKYVHTDATRVGGSVGGPHIHHTGGVDPTFKRYKDKSELYAKLARGGDAQ